MSGRAQQKEIFLSADHFAWLTLPSQNLEIFSFRSHKLKTWAGPCAHKPHAHHPGNHGLYGSPSLPSQSLAPHTNTCAHSHTSVHFT